MREKLFGTLRSAMALILVLSIVVGFVPAMAFAAAEPIRYVSLGDSMSNGYGLGGGYDSTGKAGYNEIDKYTYPYYFQKYLAKLNGWNGENEANTLTDYAQLTQLATSGMRAEDLHYILKAGTENAIPCDEWTKFDILNSCWSDPDVAKVFQTAVTDADVITMAVGNANFGVHLFDVINMALGMSDKNIDTEHYTLENGLKLFHADAQIESLVGTAYETIESYFGAYVSPDMTIMLADRISYVLASYLYHYEAALDRIVELNPDVEVIVIGLMNTMSYLEVEITANGKTKLMDLGELLDLLVDPMNLYLTKLPGSKQANGEYQFAKFYYAELDRIETISETFKTIYKDENSIIRQNFVSSTVDDGNGSLWKLLKSAGMELQNINYADVKEYESYVYATNDEAAQIQGLLAYAADASRIAKIQSIATYIALENAILDALEQPIYLNLDELNASEGGIIGGIESSLTKTFRETPILKAAVQSNLEKVATAYVNAVVLPNLPPMDDDQTAAALRGALEEAMASDEVIGLTTAFVAPNALAEDMLSNKLCAGFLCKYGRMDFANGLSSHCGKKDHCNLADKIISAYGKKTADDAANEQTMDLLWKVYNLIKKYRAEIAATQPQAISAKIPMDDNFKYVAIGDTSAVSKSYVDDVAAALNDDAAKNGVGPIKMVNLAKNDNTVADELANLSDVAGADLITIGFSNVTFLSKTLQNKVVIDWASCVGEENVHYVEELLATIDEILEGSGMNAQFKTFVKNLLECYAYSAAEYIFGMPKLIEAIQEVNPDAVIVIVGMYNPLKGVEISLDAETSLGFGDYIDYLVDIVAAQGFAYAVSTENVIYVDAREVETNSINSKLDMMGMLTLLTKIQNMYPTANGHAYIKDQIMKALTLTYGLLGDVNGDGAINILDLMRLANYFAVGNSIEMLNSDVNGDGAVTILDLMRFANYFAGSATLG